ncbi:MAG: DNA polymerase III subunit epsilon [Proteobacteria bacterium SW_6_67_9]|nr:MAG: DNA polymerase III subunit epsilon [Proteobacteria bacterium SW_6_67_9]
MSQRQIVLDTETTGLEPQHGHRIIEIGAIELVHRRVTGNRYHQYINPERAIEEGAEEVHGITNDWLADKPAYRDIAGPLLEFVRGAELIIHNAPFDVAFLNAELAWLGPEWGQIEDYCSVHDSLVQARECHPGQRNSLDALCKRYDIDNSGRDLHGALLDAELLAEVYLAMTGGQTALGLPVSAASEAGRTAAAAERLRQANVAVVRADEDEVAAHRARLDEIAEASGGACLWHAESE